MGICNPRQTIIVTCRDKDFDVSETNRPTDSVSEHAQKPKVFDNAVTLSWHAPVSFDPFLYGIFLAKKRKSMEMIRNSKEFCVNFLTETQEDLAVFCGTNSGHKVNKFKEANIPKEECSEIDCPKIKDCSAYLECKVKDIVEVGDHYMVVGEVTKQVEGNNKKKLFQSNISGPYTFTTTKD